VRMTSNTDGNEAECRLIYNYGASSGEFIACTETRPYHDAGD
jgi:hypothetical protein